MLLTAWAAFDLKDRQLIGRPKLVSNLSQTCLKTVSNLSQPRLTQARSSTRQSGQARANAMHTVHTPLATVSGPLPGVARPLGRLPHLALPSLGEVARVASTSLRT